MHITTSCIQKSVQPPLNLGFDLNEAEMEECSEEQKASIERGLRGDPEQDIGPIDDRLASALRQALDRSAEEMKQAEANPPEEPVEEDN